MKKFQSQGKQALVEVGNIKRKKMLVKTYGLGKCLNKDEVGYLLQHFVKYHDNLSNLHLETNIPQKIQIIKNGDEYVIRTEELLRGFGFDLHESLLSSIDKQDLLQKLQLYYTLMLQELLLIPSYNNNEYSSKNQYVLVPFDFRPCNFVLENKEDSDFRIVNIDTFAPRIWKKKGEILYFPKIEDQFPAAKAHLLHLLMGNMRYMFGRLYGTTMLIITQWAKEKEPGEIGAIRSECSQKMLEISKKLLLSASGFSKEFKMILINDLEEVKMKRLEDSPYEGSQLIQDFWQKLDKGILRDFK